MNSKLIRNTQELNTQRMGLSGNGCRILDKIITLENNEEKKINQKYIAKILDLSLTTVNAQLNKMEELGYITSFFADNNKKMLKYKVNHDFIYKFKKKISEYMPYTRRKLYQ